MKENSEATLAKITIIAGNNQFEKRSAKAEFLKKVENLFPNSNNEHFDGTADISFGEFAQQIVTASMFGDTKILFFNHAESKNVLSNKTQFETFERNMSICVDEVFVFVEIDNDGGEKASKTNYSAVELMEKLKILSKNLGGSFSEYWTMRDYEIPKWIMIKVRENYARFISEPNAELLVRLSGSDLGILDGELKKIDAALDAKNEITENDIYELTGNNRQITSQEIANFLAFRKWNIEVVEAFDELSSKDSSFAIPFLSELYRKFWVLLKIRLYAEENRSKANQYFKTYDRSVKNQLAFEIANACGILKSNEIKSVYPRIIKPQIIEQASNFKKNDLYEIIKKITQHDRDIKNGVIKFDSHRETTKELCRQIVRIGR